MTLRVRIYESQIARESLPGGDVRRWVSKIGKETFALASANCPVRTGELLRSIGWGVTPHPAGCQATIRATADYALFVHEGTTGPIYPTLSRYLVVRPMPHSHYSDYTRRNSVRGQSANPFIQNAFEDVLQRHRV